MEYPKKSWCLYLKGKLNDIGEDLSKYDGCVGYELSRDETSAQIKINNKLVYRKEDYPKEIIRVPIKELKLGYLSEYQVNYIKKSIKSFQENEYLKEKDFWYLYTIFGYFNSLEILLKNKGILNNETIEGIANNCNQKYTIFKYKNGYILTIGIEPVHITHTLIEEISSLETMKRYGLQKMDYVLEKNWCVISLSDERDRKLNNLL